MYNCNFFSLPLIILLVIFTELKGVVAYDNFNSVGFLICFFGSAIQAFFLNYFMFLCTTVNSALTTSITGQIKAIVTTIMGLFMFGDVVITKLLVAGLAVSTVGSIYYAYVKYAQKQKQQKEKALQEKDVLLEEGKTQK